MYVDERDLEGARAAPPSPAPPASPAPTAAAAGRAPKNYRRSDVRLLEDFHDRLAHDPLIDSSEVGVAVSDGIVTLDGTVPHRWHRYALEDAVASRLGVADVINRVRVVGQNPAESDFGGC